MDKPVLIDGKRVIDILEKLYLDVQKQDLENNKMLTEESAYKALSAAEKLVNGLMNSSQCTVCERKEQEPAEKLPMNQFMVVHQDGLGTTLIRKDCVAAFGERVIDTTCGRSYHVEESFSQLFQKFLGESK